MPPLFREGRSRRSWRREVAEGLLRRVDVEGQVKFVGTHPNDRAEMLRIAEMLPDDVIAELYEDPAYPGYTFMELTLAGYEEAGFDVVQPDSTDTWATGGGF